MQKPVLIRPTPKHIESVNPEPVEGSIRKIKTYPLPQGKNNFKNFSTLSEVGTTPKPRFNLKSLQMYKKSDRYLKIKKPSIFVIEDSKTSDTSDIPRTKYKNRGGYQNIESMDGIRKLEESFSFCGEEEDKMEEESETDLINSELLDQLEAMKRENYTPDLSLMGNSYHQSHLLMRSADSFIPNNN